MSSPSSLVPRSAAAMGRAIARRKLDPVDLAEEAYARIEAAGDPAIFISLTRERAMREARAARKRAKEGKRLSLLDGVPMAWKDLTHLKGSVTTFGSLLYRKHAPAKADAPVAANCAASGLVSIGKTNLSEFAFSGLGANPGFGTPENPHGPGRLPGGSSSGSAVAVARGIVPVASGSDTAGSVRIPAAWCGITGYQSSYRHFDMRGNLVLSPNLDTLGVLARDVQDCHLVASAFSGVKIRPLKPHPLNGVRIIVPANDLFDGAEDAVVANFEACLSRLSRAGARIKRQNLASIDRFRALLARHGHIAGVEAYYLHKDEMDGPEGDKIDPLVAQRIRAAANMSAYDYVAVLQARDDLIAQFADETKGAALIAYPTMLTVAPTLAQATKDFSSFMDHAGRSIRNTLPGNFLKLCGLAMPSGTGAHDLPTSLLLAARQGEDETLLALGLAAEQVLAFN